MSQNFSSPRMIVTVVFSLLCCGASLTAASLDFSGSLTGIATENPAGRCPPPFITVNAGGFGASNLLGAFSDTQSHCTTSPSTFGDGLFTLTSLSKPADSFSGVYSGTASVTSAGVLDFLSFLTVTGGSGDYVGVSGTLNSSGTLAQTGVFTATFNGSLMPAPEPGALAPMGLLLLLSADRLLGRGKRKASPQDLHLV